MTAKKTPGMGLYYDWVLGEYYKEGMDLNLRKLDTFVHKVAISNQVTAQPGSPADGDTYILPASSTGTDWAGKDTYVASYNGDTAAWDFYEPEFGMVFDVKDTVYGFPLPFEYLDSTGWGLPTFEGKELAYDFLATTINVSSADYTLSDAESGFGVYIITSAGSISDIILPSSFAWPVNPCHFFNFGPGDIRVRFDSDAGAGVIVPPGVMAPVICLASSPQTILATSLHYTKTEADLLLAGKRSTNWIYKTYCQALPAVTLAIDQAIDGTVKMLWEEPTIDNTGGDVTISSGGDNTHTLVTGLYKLTLTAYVEETSGQRCMPAVRFSDGSTAFGPQDNCYLRNNGAKDVKGGMDLCEIYEVTGATADLEVWIGNDTSIAGASFTHPQGKSVLIIEKLD